MENKEYIVCEDNCAAVVNCIPEDGMYVALMNDNGNIVYDISKIYSFRDNIKYGDAAVDVEFEVVEETFNQELNSECIRNLDMFCDHIDGLTLVVYKNGKDVYHVYDIEGKKVKRSIELSQYEDIPNVVWSISGYLTKVEDEGFEKIIGNRSYVFSNILDEYGDKPYTSDECLCFSTDISGYGRRRLSKEFDLKEGDNLYIVDSIHFENGLYYIICWNKCTNEYVIVPNLYLNKYGVEKSM